MFAAERLRRLFVMLRHDVADALDREHPLMRRIKDTSLRHDTILVAVFCVVLLILMFAGFLLSSEELERAPPQGSQQPKIGTR